jgi:hypothetical protein
MPLKGADLGGFLGQGEAFLHVLPLRQLRGAVAG